MPIDSNSKFPPLPEIYTDKVKGIDPQGCEEKQREMNEWYLKLINSLVQQGGN